MKTLLIVIFALLQVTDGMVTYFGLNFAGVDEVNPVLNLFVELIGLGYSIAVLKLAGLVFVTFLFIERHKMKSLWITATLASADSFYSWVVVNNFSLVLA